MSPQKINQPEPQKVSTPICTPVEEKQQHLRGGRAVVQNSEQYPLNLIQHQQNFLPLVQKDDFLPPISRWTSLGGLILAGAVGIAFGLACVIQYKVTVKAHAIVRPAGEIRLVQAATEGSIISISVQENQSVKKDDVIAIIDDSQLQTKKSQLESSVRQSQLQLLQINAQIVAVDSQIQAESNRIQGIVASAKAELSQRQREYRDRKITTDAQVQEAEANLKQAQNELQKAKKELHLRKANLRSAEVTLNISNSKWERYRNVAKEGALSQNQLEEAQLAVEQQKQEVKVQKATFEAHKQVIEQQKQAVESARARWQGTQAGLNPSQAEVEIAYERIAQEKASGEATFAILDKEQEALIQQQIQISKQLERDTRELQQIEIDLSKTTITATANGIISHLNLRNSGQNVRSGEEIAQIVPTDVPLKIKAAVSPQHINKLAEGQNVQMRVSACPYTDYGTLKGVVSQISEDTIKPQVSGTSTISSNSSTQNGYITTAFYEVIIEPKNLSLGSGKNHCAIQLGMEGRVDIISREETVLQYLLRTARLLADF